MDTIARSFNQNWKVFKAHVHYDGRLPKIPLSIPDLGYIENAENWAYQRMKIVSAAPKNPSNDQFWKELEVFYTFIYKNIGK